MTEAESLSALNRPNGASCYETSLSVTTFEKHLTVPATEWSMTQFRPQGWLACSGRHNA
jgi:hypothetical protein